MESQHILKSEKVTVVSDYRERDVSKALKKFGAEIKVMPLETGDFVCSDRLVIERKSHSDFVSSIIDGRIFDQAKRMRDNFEKPIFIIEGTSNRNITANSMKATIASLAVNYGVSIISTKNKTDTALTIFWLAKKEQHESDRELSVRVGKRPKNKKKLQEQIVCGLPGISNVICRRLLDEFGTVENVFSANEEELMKVEGIGKTMASKIRDIVKKDY